MDWDTILYLSIIGTAITLAIVTLVTGLGIRHKRELPKLPIKESIAALKMEREREEVELGQIEDELAEARMDIHEGTRVREYLENARPEMERLQAETREYQDSKAQAEREFASVVEEKDRLAQEVDDSEEERNRLSEEIAPLRVDLAETKARLERAKEDLEDYEEKREELHTLEAKLPGLREEYDSLQSSVTVDKEESVRLQDNLLKLKEEQARVVGEVEARTIEIERLVKEEERRIQSIEELKRVHASAGGVDESVDSRQDLWIPCFPKRREAGGVQEETQRLQAMRDQLQKAGVRFSERTVWSFHTALKVQDISPLTVLAGISGTGKSLLPALYARCMGIHFLNLPVQPGWNSPQDLFGFYNYIEHKFKATPLARALVQFDGRNRHKWPLPEENICLDDQVLLVLLDEMNLARVEYYFSELLSRLEVRRSINEHDVRARSSVEIPLEIGHALRRTENGVEDLSVSVYPGENVLFTGTMNEDESTMSLSDKVLDRATVLRFGRPKETVTSQPDISKISASAPLALEVWKEWLKPRALHGEVKQAAKFLEDVLASAGSPIGHRVPQGIEQYIALYPGTGRVAQQRALCDQIEQKILPKLRGRELSSIDRALDGLISIAREHDEEQLLENAILKGRDNALEGTFIWQGLDRPDPEE